MTTEARARVEQEVVHRVGAERLGCEGVLEAAGAQVRESRLHEVRIGAGALPQRLRQRDRARIHSPWQGGRVLLPGEGAQRLQRAGAGVRDGVETDGLGEWLAAEQLVVIREEHVDVGGLRRRVEREPPALSGGFQCHAVAVGRAQILQALAQVKHPGRAPPGVTVELVQHRTAPIALLGRRSTPGKLHAEGGVVAGHEFADAAGTHGVGQPGHRLAPARDRPKSARHAREEQEQQHRQRHSEQERPSREPQRCAPSEACGSDHGERAAARPRL